MSFIVAIDGPAGTGKGTITKLHFIMFFKLNLLIKPTAKTRKKTIYGIGVFWKYMVFKFSDVFLNNKEATNRK